MRTGHRAGKNFSLRPTAHHARSQRQQPIIAHDRRDGLTGGRL